MQRRFLRELEATVARVAANRYHNDDDGPETESDPPTLVDDLAVINRLIRYVLVDATQANALTFRSFRCGLVDNRCCCVRTVRSAIFTQHHGPIEATHVSAIETWLRTLRANVTVIDGATLPVAFRVDTTDICVFQGDITALRADAIVNAANSAMLGCFTPFHACIDNVIGYCAGPRLRLACEAMMADAPLEPIGRCRMTPAFELPSRYVCHTVGPDLREFGGVEQPQLLADCYR